MINLFFSGLWPCRSILSMRVPLDLTHQNVRLFCCCLYDVVCYTDSIIHKFKKDTYHCDSCNHLKKIETAKASSAIIFIVFILSRLGKFT